VHARSEIYLGAEGDEAGGRARTTIYSKFGSRRRPFRPRAKRKRKRQPNGREVVLSVHRTRLKLFSFTATQLSARLPKPGKYMHILGKKWKSIYLRPVAEIERRVSLL